MKRVGERVRRKKREKRVWENILKEREETRRESEGDRNKRGE